MQQGGNLGEYTVKSRESLTLRVVAVGTGQLETVSGATRDPAAPGPGHVYRLVITGQPGEIKHVVIGCNFPDEQKPPGHYRFELDSDADGHFEPPMIHAPDTYPQSPNRNLRFIIVA